MKDNINSYIDNIPEDKKSAFIELRNIINKNIPKGFEECMQYGMLSWVVPHKLYPKGYHCKPEEPLPFLAVAAQKNHISIYHMGIYADTSLMDWYINEFNKISKSKADIGKSCIRFKKVEQIPMELIGALVTKMTPQDWIIKYEEAFTKK